MTLALGGVEWQSRIWNLEVERDRVAGVYLHHPALDQLRAQIKHEYAAYDAAYCAAIDLPSLKCAERRRRRRSCAGQPVLDQFMKQVHTAAAARVPARVPACVLVMSPLVTVAAFVPPQGVLDMPEEAAAQTMGMSTTLLKKLARGEGIAMWPYRHRASLNTLADFCAVIWPRAALPFCNMVRGLLRDQVKPTFPLRKKMVQARHKYLHQLRQDSAAAHHNVHHDVHHNASLDLLYECMCIAMDDCKNE